jgi:hypothetical protein
MVVNNSGLAIFVNIAEITAQITRNTDDQKKEEK